MDLANMQEKRHEKCPVLVEQEPGVRGRWDLLAVCVTAGVREGAIHQVVHVLIEIASL